MMDARGMKKDSICYKSGFAMNQCSVVWGRCICYTYTGCKGAKCNDGVKKKQLFFLK